MSKLTRYVTCSKIFCLYPSKYTVLLKIFRREMSWTQIEVTFTVDFFTRFGYFFGCRNRLLSFMSIVLAHINSSTSCYEYRFIEYRLRVLFGEFI